MPRLRRASRSVLNIIIWYSNLSSASSTYDDREVFFRDFYSLPSKAIMLYVIRFILYMQQKGTASERGQLFSLCVFVYSNISLSVETRILLSSMCRIMSRVLHPFLEVYAVKLFFCRRLQCWLINSLADINFVTTCGLLIEQVT
jgi:hypothetical protein